MRPGTWLHLAELAALGLLLLCVHRGGPGARGFERAGAGLARALGRLAARPALAVLLPALLAGLGAAAVALLVQRPLPGIHDETSVLLAAETFARGQLANPTPPAPDHLAQFHVLSAPTWQSKYPPGNAVVLAAGRVLGGDALVGVWLGAALMGAALGWMLRAFAPPRWALAATLAGVLQFGIASYWSQSYWGGAPAVAAGALVWGAVPRLERRARARDAALFALGLVGLAVTRPYEGLVVALPAIALVLRALARMGGAERRAVTAAGLAVFLPCAAALGAYQHAVTGSVWRLPYLVHDAAFALVPPFPWLALAERPVYPNPEFEAYWTGHALELYERARSLTGFLREALSRTVTFWGFLVGVPLSLPLVAALRAPRDAWTRRIAAVLVLLLAALLVEVFRMAHYAAPGAGLLLALVAIGLRRIARGRGGLAVVLGIVLVLCGQLALQVAARSSLVEREWDWRAHRAALDARLAQEPEEQLVIVRYGPLHSEHEEWIWNGPDPVGQRVVWARDLGSEREEELLEGYPGRQVWDLAIGFEGVAYQPVPRVK